MWSLLAHALSGSNEVVYYYWVGAIGGGHKRVILSVNLCIRHSSTSLSAIPWQDFVTYGLFCIWAWCCFRHSIGGTTCYWHGQAGSHTSAYHALLLTLSVRKKEGVQPQFLVSKAWVVLGYLQVWAAAVSTGPDNISLNASFKNADGYAFQVGYGRISHSHSICLSFIMKYLFVSSFRLVTTRSVPLSRNSNNLMIPLHSIFWVSVALLIPTACLSEGFLHLVSLRVNCFDLKDAVGTVLEEVFKVVPDGALTFFPSYKLLDKLCARWKSTGQWVRLSNQKELFVGK